MITDMEILHSNKNHASKHQATQNNLGELRPCCAHELRDKSLFTNVVLDICLFTLVDCTWETIEFGNDKSFAVRYTTNCHLE